ncbi:MAG: hypothetical protein ACKOKF_01550 [Bacteroidota bacterium]
MFSVEQIKQIILRIVATFAANALGIVGAGAIAGIPIWKAAFIAGIGGVSQVVEKMARAYMDDGKLSIDEINQIFGDAKKDVEDKKAAQDKQA